jgi:hypothetical protein
MADDDGDESLIACVKAYGISCGLRILSSRVLDETHTSGAALLGYHPYVECCSPARSTIPVVTRIVPRNAALISTKLRAEFAAVVMVVIDGGGGGGWRWW